MAESNRAAVAEALSAWREAERALDAAGLDDPERAARLDEAARLKAQYQRAVLASRGRIDQLEAAATTTWDRIASGAEHAEDSRERLAIADGTPDLGEARSVR